MPQSEVKHLIQITEGIQLSRGFTGYLPVRRDFYALSQTDNQKTAVQTNSTEEIVYERPIGIGFSMDLEGRKYADAS